MSSAFGPNGMPSPLAVQVVRDASYLCRLLFPATVSLLGYYSFHSSLPRTADRQESLEMGVEQRFLVDSTQDEVKDLIAQYRAVLSGTS